MSLRFLDTNDVPLPTIYRMPGIGGSPTEPFTVRFECRDGYFLWAIASTDVTVEARLEGNTAWTDIVADPIDVSSYAPDNNNFQIRLTPAIDEDYEISLIVSEDPGGSVVNGDEQLVLNGNRQYVLR